MGLSVALGSDAPTPMRGNSSQQKQRRLAEEKRRREEAELRILIQQAMEEGRTLHGKILQNETQVAVLSKQVEVQTSAVEADLKQLEAEGAKWEEQLRKRQGAINEKRAVLEDLDRRLKQLRAQRSLQKVCLSAQFIPKDWKPDVKLDDGDVADQRQNPSSPSPRTPRSHGGGGEDADAASPSPERRLSMRGPQRSRRTASVVLTELELEPALEHLRPKLHQVQHDSIAERTAFTQQVRTQLQDLYAELASLGDAS